MSKLLEDITDQHKREVELSTAAIDWLIEQSEKFEKLEKLYDQKLNDTKMDYFLEELASKKWAYTQYLKVRKPCANTSEDCFERIKTKEKYEEVLSIINDLPFEYKNIVNEKYADIVSNY